MYILLTILIVIAALALTLLVLAQNSKGGGLTSTFASSNQIMGVSKTTNFLEKATWTLIAIIMVLSVLATHFIDKGNTVKKASALTEEAQNMQQQESAPAIQGIDMNNTETE